MYTEPTGIIHLHVPAAHEQGNAIGNNTAIRNSTLGTPQIRDLTPSTRIVDPTDSDFDVTYQRNGDAMPCVDLLGTALYAIATAAQADNDEYCRYLGGWNEERAAVYQIHGRRPTEPGFLLSYGLVRGLNLLSARLYDRNACGKVDFSLVYKADVLGGGMIRLNDFADKTARAQPLSQSRRS